jgi:mono/diheme cytochrome c family protein
MIQLAPRWYVAGLFTLASTVTSSPVFGADAANGERLAVRWCIACHTVAPDKHQAANDLTPFHEIAKRPDFDAAKLSFFLLNPHPVMPNMGLSRSEAADLAAYIATLK